MANNILRSLDYTLDMAYTESNRSNISEFDFAQIFLNII